jgi:hypothetical protein
MIKKDRSFFIILIVGIIVVLNFISKWKLIPPLLTLQFTVEIQVVGEK